MSNMLRFTHCYLVVLSLVVLCGASFGADYYVSGTTGYAPEVTSANAEPFALAEGDTLTLKVDRGAEQTVVFHASDFIRSTISQAQAAEVAYILHTRMPGITTFAVSLSGISFPGQRFEPPYRIGVRSSRTDSGAAIQVTGGTANAKFGFPTEEFSYGDGTQARPFKTISDALSFVTGTESNLANIRVAAGMYYRENVTMEDHTNLWGGYEPGTWTRDIVANETVIDGRQRGVTPTLKFENNIWNIVDGFTIKAGDGGGIVCITSSPIIQNNNIIGDRDGYGVGISCSGSASAMIQDNIIAGHSGGGISCGYSSPTIRNNIVTGNLVYSAWGSRGGGIHCWNSSPLIEGNMIIGNGSEYGGGIFCFINSSPTIQNNIISGNHGGGIYSEQHSSPVVRGNIISGNQDRLGRGGGIYCSYSDSSPIIENNVISGNQVLKGGGIYVDGYVLATIQNNTISHNLADEGGGIHCYTSSPVVTNNLFFENSNYDVYEGFYQFDMSNEPEAHYNEFYGSTPGIWYDEGTTALATIEEVNALAEADANVSVPPGFLPSLTGISTDITYDLTTFQSTLTDTSASFSPGTLVGQLLNPKTTQPLEFVIASNTETTITAWGDITTIPSWGGTLPLASAGDPYKVFDYHLASDSALIDAGTTTPVADDIDGDARPQGAGYDIGADEFRSASASQRGEGEGEVQPLQPPDSELEFEPGLLEDVELELGDVESEGEVEGEEPTLPEERVYTQQEPESGEGEIEEEAPPEQETGNDEDASPTPTPSVLTLCPAARTTASTALAAKIERLREWRDGLLETRFGEAMVKLYYGRE